MDYVKLNNGVVMPQIGLGTFLLSPAEAKNSVKHALLSGYRMIDTANAYVNEKAVGEGIRESGIPRDEIFVSTKIWASEYENANAVDETLMRLGLDYIDLLFIHQPCKMWRAGYRMLVDAYKAGKIRAIGISNFEDEIKNVLSEFDVIPQVIQVECHPAYPQDELRKITDDKNIEIMSWYPLGGKGNQSFLKNEKVLSIAKKHGKSASQVLLRWHIQMGFIVIPGSTNPDHIKENFDVFDFALDEEDMSLMSSLNTGNRIFHPTDELLENFAKFHPSYEK